MFKDETEKMCVELHLTHDSIPLGMTLMIDHPSRKRSHLQTSHSL